MSPNSKLTLILHTIEGSFISLKINGHDRLQFRPPRALLARKNATTPMNTHQHANRPACESSALHHSHTNSSQTSKSSLRCSLECRVCWLLRNSHIIGRSSQKSIRRLAGRHTERLPPQSRPLQSRPLQFQCRQSNPPHCRDLVCILSNFTARMERWTQRHSN